MKYKIQQHNHSKVGCNFSYFATSRIDNILLDIFFHLLMKKQFFSSFFPENIGKSVISLLRLCTFQTYLCSCGPKLLLRKNKLPLIAFVHNNEAVNSHNLFVFGILMFSCQAFLYPPSHRYSLESFYWSYSAHKLSLKYNFRTCLFKRSFPKSKKISFEFTKNNNNNNKVFLLLPVS